MSARNCLSLFFMLMAASPAVASGPVPFRTSGCVIEGFFIEATGHYAIHPRVKSDKSSGAPLDLTKYEGRSLMMNGLLSPGDNYVLNSLPTDVGPCPDDFRPKVTEVLAWAFVSLARAHRATGALEKALVEINRALELDPTLCAYERRADILAAMGRIEEARADAKHAAAQTDCRDIDREWARKLLERLPTPAPQKVQ